MYNVKLVRCRRTDRKYQEIRSRHYVKNNGSIGQQLHYLIFLDNKVVGIISGGSSAYAVKVRDEFFGITSDNREVALNGIIDNTVFRLEEHLPNLGTQVLSIWRKQVVEDWKFLYGVTPCGFETFIVEESYRVGSMYKADNWTYVGSTSGSTKVHNHGAENPHVRKSVDSKLVFCKWIKGAKLPTEYKSTWNPNSYVVQHKLFSIDD